MKDQGQGSHDALLTLQNIVQEVEAAGVDKATLLRKGCSHIQWHKMVRRGFNTQHVVEVCEYAPLA
jgi:hypothetical protein